MLIQSLRSLSLVQRFTRQFVESLQSTQPQLLLKLPTLRLRPTLVHTYAIGEYAHVGAYTRLEAGVVVGASVTVGDDCVLHPNVVLYDGVSIGSGVILHAGVCIGADGFGYVRHDLGYQKFPQIGTVVIEDDVEIGAHTCVDRAALGRTRIGRGTKLDNMVHVGHNCDIGERVVIAAQTGISGSVVIEDDAVIGGQVGFGDHTRVQKGAIIGSKAGILPGKIVRPGVWWGIPVQPLDQYKRMNAHLSRLPQMREELKRLETANSRIAGSHATKAQMAHKSEPAPQCLVCLAR